jgi:hypothetical protein
LEDEQLRTLTPFNADAASKAACSFAQAVQVDGDAAPLGFDEQAAVVWEKVLAQLAVAGMSTANLVEGTTVAHLRSLEIIT